MGEKAAETVREIEDIRGRLENDIRELEERLPAAGMWARRAATIAAGAGGGATVLLVLVRRLRKRRGRKAKEAEQATSSSIVQILPEFADALKGALDGGRWKPWVGWAFGAWLILRLAELRQLRRLQRAVLTGHR